MKNSVAFNRRHFLKAGLAGSLAIATIGHTSTAVAAVSKPQRDAFCGLKMGVASYSLRSFSLDQAIAMTKAMGVKYITLKDMHLPMKSTTAERQEARKKVEAAGLTLMGGGVIYLKKDEEQVKAAFEYVKDAGMPTMVSSPDLDALDLVEKYAKEYDIKIAIHNHGPGDKHYPSPLDVLRMVKDRDARMGICMDVGHTVRINEDPVAVIKECAGRLYDFHIKDVTEPTAKGSPTEVGRGIIDIPAVLKTLLEVKFNGHLALEYEIKEKDPMPGMVESFAFMRGVLAGLNS